MTVAVRACCWSAVIVQLLRESEVEDAQVGGRIEQLVAEVEELKVSLDQCCHMLRQHRALREAGGNPHRAEVRRAEVVERYEQ